MKELNQNVTETELVDAGEDLPDVWERAGLRGDGVVLGYLVTRAG